MDVVIKGKRVGQDRIVVIKSDSIAAPLNPRNDLVNHSPDGFNWGYSGSGPLQLSFAILFEYARLKFENELDAFKYAKQYYSRFCDSVISVMPVDEFTISFEYIKLWLDSVK